MVTAAEKVIFANYIDGTVNQVNVADDGDGTVTLSTPQDIATTSNPSQFSITGSNTFQFYLLPADTTGLTASTYVYDFQILTYTGYRYTIVKDKFELLSDVTR
jgi:predicted ATP-grasp superfamily ATP-dependent carboligase